MSTKFDSASCPYYEHAVEIIGRRWAGAVVRVMLAGRSRFSEIRNAIPGITDRVLSHRLRDLEADGILVREIHDERPVRIEYRLTERGRALATVVLAISSWANEWLPAKLESATRQQGDRQRASAERRGRPQRQT
jgi:DNA-binding HxlR family transcriptional regulator